MGRKLFPVGLVDQLVSHAEAEKEIEKLIELLKQNAPGAVKKTKELFVDLEIQTYIRRIERIDHGYHCTCPKGRRSQGRIGCFFQ